jgi:CHAD domain-containing protein
MHNLTFDVPENWIFPALDLLTPAGGQVVPTTAQQSSTYFDTAERDLARLGMSLHRRRADAETEWQLSLPDDAPIQIRSAANGQHVPKVLRDLLLGARLGGSLRPIARVNTDQTVRQITTADGTAIGEIADRTMHATLSGDSAVLASWRSVDVAANGDGELLASARRWLKQAGATPEKSSEPLVRALDHDTDRPADAGSPGTVNGLVQNYLQQQYEALIRGDLGLRRGLDVVHPTRVATRRFRSVLRVFDLFEPERAAALDAELAWYAGLLGAVRDRQVLRARLNDEVHALPAELVLGPVSARIDNELLAEELHAREALAQAMASRRYLGLLRDVRDWVLNSPWTEPARPAKDVARYMQASYAKLQRQLKRASKTNNEEALHRARKAGKRARYTSELAEPKLGKRARRMVKQATALQDELGDHQDSVGAAAALRRLATVAGTTPGENGFTYGVLWAEERQRAERARRRAGKTAKSKGAPGRRK